MTGSRIHRYWWAIVAALTLVAVLVSDAVAGADPKNDWLNVAVLGAGTAIIGVVLRRHDAKLTLYVIAAIVFGVAIAMTPLEIVPKIALIAADIGLADLVVWRTDRRRPTRRTPHRRLHPQP